jgi:hypothetical protein
MESDYTYKLSFTENKLKVVRIMKADTTDTTTQIKTNVQKPKWIQENVKIQPVNSNLPKNEKTYDHIKVGKYSHLQK